MQGKPYCCNVGPSASDNVYAWFEGFRTFLYVLTNVVKVFGAVQIMCTSVSVPVRHPDFLQGNHNSWLYICCICEKLTGISITLI